MKKIKGMLLSATMLLSGCALMVSGTTQEVEFISSPPGATVSFQGKSCLTPCRLEVQRNAIPSSVEFSLAGHKPHVMELQSVDLTHYGQGMEGTGSRVAMGMAGSLLIVPALVDIGMGAYKEWPKTVTATLPAIDTQDAAMIKIAR
jgi:hypothetical protein